MPLHPQAARLLEAIAQQNPPDWPEMTPEEGRQMLAEWTDLFGDAEPVERLEDHTIAGDVPVRIYGPGGERPPVVMYFHGGGWVLGDINTHDALCRRLANRSSCAVISVDYRRAPEHRFPAALDDCFAATAYVAENADQLQVDATHLAVAGDSAGGNLAAAVALMARDRGGPAIAAQHLIYPALDPHMSTRSYHDFQEGFGLTRSAMAWFWQQYLGEAVNADEPYAAPARAEDLRGLPPTHVLTAEFDVLRDEGEAFAERLMATDVRTSLRRYDGMLHGFVHLCGALDDGQRAIAELGQTLKEALCD